MDGVQAFMAVLEGYAEHVMDAVGAEVLADLPRLRAALERRRADRTGLLRLLEKLIGMDMKLRQYEQGKRFCDGVVERAGIDGAQPRVGGAGPDADAGRARRPGRLARAHRARRGLTDQRSDPVPPAGRSAARAIGDTMPAANARSVCYKVWHGLSAFHADSRKPCNKVRVRFTNMCSEGTLRRRVSSKFDRLTAPKRG